MVDNTDLQLMDFVFGSQTVRSGIAEDGSIWFVAKDVCAVLEIVNVSDAVSRLADEDKMCIAISDSGPRYVIISEPGLYEIMRC